MSWTEIEATKKHRTWKCSGCGAMASAGLDHPPPSECGKCHLGAPPAPPVKKRRR